MDQHEHPLEGGNVSVGVVRVAGTVRKRATDATPAVGDLLRHLEAAGFAGAPRFHGVDGRGRQILDYVDGPLADTLAPMSLQELARVGRLIRDLHDATSTYVPAGDAMWSVAIAPDREEIICHHDLAPWNLVCGEAGWVFIDWDGAGPGSRLWDLGYAAHGFVPLRAGGDPGVDGMRLRALVEGYGLAAPDRRQLPWLIERHVRGMHDLLLDGHRTGRQPWARLYAEGHADHWLGAADYIAAHLHLWREALAEDPEPEPDGANGR
ncbi:phosphotransferase [Arthrobacter sp.]|uniref:phosphotransferase n=1 Tax=Arthrobacter sp. TaxID=1667 RepID=UPI003A9333A2